MYKHIYIPVDNSEHSDRAIDLGLRLAKAFGAKVTGSHVYAAKLHDVRFKQMEFTLPEEYQEETELGKQRKIHDSLITMGLQLISDSYLDAMEGKCRAEGIPFERKMTDGKNWERIVAEIEEGDYDLVILGALGTGAVKHSTLGSVCERVVRRVKRDVLVVKDTRPPDERSGPVVVGVDGSPQSFAGVKTALALAKVFGAETRAVAVYDPYLHYTVFNGIVNVLSEKASSVFRFKDQEQLHEDIIDTGLAKIYQSHLEVSAQVAKEQGGELQTFLKDGKAFEKVYEFAAGAAPRLLVLGRIGVHSSDGMDIGSNAENLLRLASCDVLLVSQKFVPPIDLKAEAAMVWTEEASKRFERVPEQVRRVAKTAVHRYAMERGHSIISNSIIDEVMDLFMPKTAGALQKAALAVAQERVAREEGPVYVCSTCGKITRGVRPVVCSVCRAPGEAFSSIAKKDLEELAREEGELSEEAAFDGEKMKWTLEARKLLSSIKDGYLRRRTRAQVEKAARVRRAAAVDCALVSEMMGRVEHEKETPILVTPHVSVQNEVASPLPVPERWEKEGAERPAPGPAERLGDFTWTRDALARLSRVPQGFMRDNTRLKIEEHARETAAPAITLEVAEAGIERAKKLMAEMIAAYTGAKPS